MDLDKIFKAYDVRGTYPDQLNEDIVNKVGQAFAIFTKADTILVGRDMRESGISLSKEFIKGVAAQGVNVIDLDLISTDTIYFATGKLGFPGAMLTASHNPAEYNGMKMCLAGAKPVGVETGLVEIKDMVLKGEFTPSQTPGTVEERDIMPEFIDHALSFIDVNKIKPLKVAIDAGNGMAGKLIPLIQKHLPIEVVPLYFELDGSFPNHPASPIEPENVADLIAKVKEENCDMGMAFDGDGDRVFFIDNQGNRIAAALVDAMLAEQILKKNPGEKMIYTVPCSKIFKETIEANGGEAIIDRVGHSYIKKTMADTGAIFAGEHSGHYYFRDNYKADSGLITALLVLELISELDQPFSEVLKKYQKYSAIEETNSDVDDKDKVLAGLKEKYADAKISDLDGLTFEYEDYWFNVRPSNTEPKLRLNLEADTEELRDQKAEEILNFIRG